MRSITATFRDEPLLPRASALLWLASIGAAFHDRLALYTATECLLVAALYLALSLAVVSLALLLQRGGLPGALAGSALVSALLFWQVREQTDLVHLEERPVPSLLFFALCFAPTAFLLMRRRPSRPLAVEVRAAAIPVLCLLAGSAALYAGSPRLRWHLLTHNRLFATALHYTLNDPLRRPQEIFSHRGIATQRSPRPAVSAGERRPARGADPAKPRNVALIVIDTLRADSLEVYGGDPRWMPRLNALARTAHAFTDVFANASWTGPSVCSLFTGLLPEESGFWELGNRLDERNLTLAEFFRERGFATAGFVANPSLAGELGFAQGFDLYREPKGTEAYPRADRLRREVETWLSEQTPDERGVFLYVHFMDPHTPYLVQRGPRFWEPYHHRPSYQQELEFVDREVGLLLDALREALPDPTLILVTSDHGEEFGEHGGYGHGHSLYRELIWIPLIVDTGLPAAGNIDARLEARDFFDLLTGFAISDDFSVERWARARSRSTRYASSYATPRSWRNLTPLRPYSAIRLRGVEHQGRHLIWSGFGTSLELYDLETDPVERANLAGEDPELERALLEAMEAQVEFAAVARAEDFGPGLAERLRDLGYLR